MSLDVPLISNLNVWENIALIKQYRGRYSKHDAKNLVLSLLDTLTLEHIAEKRTPDLSEEERFSVMVLRAAMFDNAVLLFSKPFELLSAHKDFTFTHNILINIDNLYTQCYVYDFAWHKERYRINDDKKY